MVCYSKSKSCLSFRCERQIPRRGQIRVHQLYDRLRSFERPSLPRLDHGGHRLEIRQRQTTRFVSGETFCILCWTKRFAFWERWRGQNVLHVSKGYNQLVEKIITDKDSKDENLVSESFIFIKMFYRTTQFEEHIQKRVQKLDLALRFQWFRATDCCWYNRNFLGSMNHLKFDQFRFSSKVLWRPWNTHWVIVKALVLCTTKQKISWLQNSQ